MTVRLDHEDDKVLAYDTDGVELGFSFVQKCYDWTIKRLDAADHRLQTMITLAISVILAGPLLKQAIGGDNGRIEWFGIALIFFVLAIGFGLWARHYGKLRIVTPRRLYRENWRKASAFVFRNEMLRHAADDCQENLRFVNVKSDVEGIVTALIALEVVALACWIAGVSSPW